MKALYLLLLFYLTPLNISQDIKHEYYVSVTNIEYVKDQQALQIISQIFIDDFEKLLQQRYDESITLAPDNDATTIDKYIKRYLNDKLEIAVNGQPVTLNYLGKDYKDDITYCYLEVEGILNPKTVAVTNTILFDVFEEQQNILRIKGLSKNKSFLLIPGNDNCMLNFN
ncbi:DUF6702 family protein [uncultured Winogradskyella sp.]|uniref:DUF6702 family protein n=1 Tax=uncultured Winogradskyella sp. TaxID=395353 RepID=UPI0026347B43|nr:DUF6702 family protein [uncultured Winogradskyella sp.]